MKILKYLSQGSIILLVYLIGNQLSKIINPFITIPGSIIGMLVLLLFLMNGFIQLKYIEETAHFFLKNMGFFFIPLGVSLIKSYTLINDIWISIIIILSLSNIIVMGTTSKITELLIKKENNI